MVVVYSASQQETPDNGHLPTHKTASSLFTFTHSFVFNTINQENKPLFMARLVDESPYRPKMYGPRDRLSSASTASTSSTASTKSRLDSLEIQKYKTEMRIKALRIQATQLSQLLPPYPCTHNIAKRQALYDEQRRIDEDISHLEKENFDLGILIHHNLRKERHELGEAVDFFSRKISL